MPREPVEKRRLLFSWFPHELDNAHQVDLLQQVGDPATLAPTPG